jgi:hypothetical protein
MWAYFFFYFIKISFPPFIFYLSGGETYQAALVCHVPCCDIKAEYTHNT